MRLVVDQIRGKGVERGAEYSKFIPKRSAGFVAKTVRTAVANAENTQSVDVDRLFVKLAKVDGAGMAKRFMPRAQGRATRIRKRLSHITIVVDELPRGVKSLMGQKTHPKLFRLGVIETWDPNGSRATIIPSYCTKIFALTIS